jgi:hypothetical protein
VASILSRRASGRHRRCGLGQPPSVGGAGSADGLTRPELGDKVSYRRESEVRAVAEAGLARTRKAHQAGGFRPAAGWLAPRPRAAGRWVVRAGQEQHGTPDRAGHGPRGKGRELVPGAVRADVPGRHGPGPAHAGLSGVLSEAAPDGGGCLVAAGAAQRRDDALLVPVAPGRAGHDDGAGVSGEQRRAGEGDEAAAAAAGNNRLVQPGRIAKPPQVISPGPQIPGPRCRDRRSRDPAGRGTGSERRPPAAPQRTSSRRDPGQGRHGQSYPGPGALPSCPRAGLGQHPSSR